MRISLVFLLLLVIYSCTNSRTARENDTDTKPVQGLIERVIPGYSGQFIIENIPDENGTDVFEIDYRDGKIVLKGNTPVSQASAFNWYLKYICNCHLSDCGYQLNLPEVLPKPAGAIRKQINGRFRFQFNYCTFNYTASWWDWEDWEREIDLMAMNGVNMPLFATGIEGVWYNALMKVGYSDAEARSFLAGPAYSAWQWMTNIQSYGGPLPKSWIDSHIELGQKIIARYRELGMSPVLQGFSGYVPRDFKEKFPNASVMLKPEWYGFTGTAQLDPLDPLFKEFGTILLKEQDRLFGKSHYYATDPFHESEPPVKEPGYLGKVGDAVHNLINDFDPEGIWVMMAWSLRKKIVLAVPKEKLLILDFNGESYRNNENFWGYPFIIGNLHNFGGRINMHGDLRLLASNQYAKAEKAIPNVIGSGIFMESLRQNPVYYDLAFEMPFHKDTVILDTWLGDYAARRYGETSENARKAWMILLNGPYKPGTNGVEKSSIIAARPAVNVKKSGPNDGFNIPYDNQQLIDACRLLLSDTAMFRDSEGYRFDLIDITRQYLSNKGQEIHKKAVASFEKGNRKEFLDYSNAFLELLHDVDNLLGYTEEYSFNKWLSDAHRWAQNEEEKRIYDFNASMLLTQWGYDEGIEPKIFDYAWKEWAGLIDGYYLPRWKYFYNFLDSCLENKTPYSEANLPLIHGREAINANDMYRKMTMSETKWINTVKTPAGINENFHFKLISSLLDKYSTLQ